MKWRLPKFQEITDPVKNNFFLKKHIPTETTMKVLKTLYPNIDWKRVDFYEGLPWFTPAVAPYVNAQALPQFYSFSKYRIYLRTFDETRPQNVADIVHEAFHVMQAMHFGKGYGVGFFRIWMIYYIAVFFKHGYRQNPFEVPAYDQEFRFMQYCEKKGLHGISPPVTSPTAYDDVGSETSLIFPSYKFKYEESPFILIASFFFCLFISVIKPVVDLFIFIIRLFIRKRKATVEG